MSVGIGIEIGSTALRAAVIERQGKALKLLAWREVPCETASPESLTQGLTHLRRALKPKAGVVLGLSSSSVLLTTVEPLIVDPRRAPLAVEFELQQNLPFALDQAAWHYQWLNGSVSSAGRGDRAVSIGAQNPFGPRAIVAAIKQDKLEERLGCCQRAGLRVLAATMNPLALLNIWKEDVGSAAPDKALMLYLGEAHAEWVVWSRGRVQVVPITVNPAAASLDLLIQEIGSSRKALLDSEGGEWIDQASTWVVGPNARLPELEGRLLSALQLRLASLELNQMVRITGESIDPIERAGVAFGLALQGAGRTSVELNLLTESQALAAVRARRQAGFAVGGLAALVAVGFGVSGMLDARSRYTRALASLEKLEEVYQGLRPEIRSLIKGQAKLEERIVSLRDLVSNRSAVSSWFVDVAAAMPDDVWLTKLEATRTDSLEGLIEGRGKSFQAVTQFLDALKELPGVRSVKPLSTQVTPDEASGREIVVFAVVIQGKAKPADDDDA